MYFQFSQNFAGLLPMIFLWQEMPVPLEINISMTMKFDKTGQHLRDQILEKGVEERNRVIQALGSGYLNDSRGALSTMFLAALGSSGNDGHGVASGGAMLITKCDQVVPGIGKVALAMQNSANDAVYLGHEISTAS